MIVWVTMAILLGVISFRYKSRTEALMAVVESQVTAVSFQKPVVIDYVRVIPGQEIRKGDTLVVVSRPDLKLDLERKSNELERMISNLERIAKNHDSKIELLSLERDGKINRLVAEKSELQTELYQQTLMKQQLNKQSGVNTNDSLNLIQLEAINSEIVDLKKYYGKEIQRERLLSQQDIEITQQGIKLLTRELEALYQEQRSLVKVAQFDGIVGTLDVQLDELVPPFKTLLTIYEAQPSIIKAFMHEGMRAPVKPGDQVLVASESRLYSITGVVQELGARITPYPAKIQPETSTAVRYGQEIFISIPKNNKFLNGEKVFVYTPNESAE